MSSYYYALYMKYNICQIAACAAFRFKDLDPSLGSRKSMSDSQAKVIFIDLVNRGHAIYPEKIWLDKVVQIYDLFNKHHKSKVGLRPGTGVVRNFEKKLHKHFPDIHKAILNFIAHLLTYGVRLRTINRLAKSKTQSLRYALLEF